MILENPELEIDSRDYFLRFFEGFQSKYFKYATYDNLMGDILEVTTDFENNIQNIDVVNLNTYAIYGKMDIKKSDNIGEMEFPFYKVDYDNDFFSSGFRFYFDEEEICFDFFYDGDVSYIYNGQRMEVGYGFKGELSYIKIKQLTNEEFKELIATLYKYGVEIVDKSDLKEIKR